MLSDYVKIGQSIQTRQMFASLKKINLTLAEIIAAILILALVAASIFLVVNYNQARNRDGQRENDLARVQQALRDYYIDHGNYPKRDSGARLEEDLGLQNDLHHYLPTGLPHDPLYPQEYRTNGTFDVYTYFYKTKDNGSEYRIFARRETGREDFITVYSPDGRDIVWTGSEPQEVVLHNCDRPFVTSNPDHLRVATSQTTKTSGVASNQITVGPEGHKGSAAGDLGVIDLLTANELHFDINQSVTGQKVLGFFAQSEFLSAGENQARAIVEDDDYIYVGLNTVPGKIVRIEKDNFDRSETKTLAQGEDRVTSLVVDDDYIFIGLETTPGRVVRLSKSDFTTTRTVLLSGGQSRVRALDQDEQYVYAGLDTSPGQIVRIHKRELGVQSYSLGEAGPGVRSLVSDGSLIYAVLGTSPARVVRLDKESGQVDSSNLAPEEDSAHWMIQDEDFLYISLATRPGRMVRVSKQTFASSSRVLPSWDSRLRAITQDERYVYLGTQTSPASIIRMDKQTLAMETLRLSTHQNEAFAITAQSEYLYVALNTEPARIVRLSKDAFQREEEAEHRKEVKELVGAASNPTVVIDDRDYLYIGLNTSPSMIARVQKNDLTRVFYQVMPEGFDEISDMDHDNYFLYATFETPTARFARISKSDFNVETEILPEQRAAAVVQDGNYIYVGFRSMPGRIRRINKNDFSDSRVISLPTGVNQITSMIHDSNYIYVSLATSPARLARVAKDDFTDISVKVLEVGSISISDLEQDDDYVYASLRMEPGIIVRLSKRDFQTTLVKTLADGENWPTSLMQKEGHVYACLATSPAKLVRLDKGDFSTTVTRTLAAGENACTAATLDSNFIYAILNTRPAQVARVLDVDFVPNVRQANVFERHSFDLSGLSVEQRSKGRYDTIIFTPYRNASRFSFFLDNIRYSR